MINDYIETETAETLQRLAALDVKNKLLAAYTEIAISDEYPDVLALLARLNQQCGTRYKMQRWSDWRNKQRAIPAGIASQMRREILQYIFAGEAAEALMQVLALER